jgi:carbon monoxide dehydrogenase subunit G
MVIQGEELLPLAPARVWEALNDPAILQQAIPGCDTLAASDEGYRITLVAAVGPVKARFAGKLALRDVRPPRSYTLVFEGTGGIAGFGKGSAEVSLAAADGGTLLAYAAQAQVGGRLAQVGSRLIDGVAARMAAEFFARFRACLLAAPAEAGALPSNPQGLPA